MLNRIPSRSKEHDYAGMGVYMVTIVTAKRRHIFGRVVAGRMVLSPAGLIAHDLWLKTRDIRSNVKLDAFVVMPNHVHVLIWIADLEGNYGFSKHASALLAEPRKLGGLVSGSLSTIIGAYKAAVTKVARRVLCRPDMPIWLGRFHDLIIRDKYMLRKYRWYIGNNPKKWSEKRSKQQSDSLPVAQSSDRCKDTTPSCP